MHIHYMYSKLHIHHNIYIPHSPFRNQIHRNVGVRGFFYSSLCSHNTVQVDGLSLYSDQMGEQIAAHRPIFHLVLRVLSEGGP